MKKYIILLLSFLSLYAINDLKLIEAAKKANMEPIPSSESELLKLIDNPDNPITNTKVELGKKLYFDPRLSKSGFISCNSCHNLGLGGADGIPAAVGHKWATNPHHLNSPTVYNAVFNYTQFWDGRSPHLEDQAQGPMQAGPEMASPKELVVKRVASIPQYVEEFKNAYGKDAKITFEKIADTIGIFERTLVTPSRFDDYLNGDANALTKEEKEGLEVFLDKGCARCHKNIGLGGSMQPFDVGQRYTYKDIGDFKGNANKLVKTPTLRNIEETAPYFHNGAVWDLKEAVKEMGKVQFVIKISDDEASKIVTFLKTLTGKKPNIIYPILPPSTEKTPKPMLE